MLETTLAANAQATASRRFYVWMSAACLAIAILGFVPTYFLPIIRGRLAVEPVVHIHGLIFYSWMIFFFVQSLLVARGRVLAHRTWGMLGIAIVTAMAFMVITIVSLRVSQASLPGQPRGLAHDVRAFEWISVSGVLFFVSVFILAIVNIRRPETHKRFILLGTIALLGAPIARWFMVFLAPPRGPGPAALTHGLPQIHVPPVFVAIPPGLLGDMLLVVAIVFDWRTRGRPHSVYVIGGACLLLIQISAVSVAASSSWQAVAKAIGHLSG